MNCLLEHKWEKWRIKRLSISEIYETFQEILKLIIEIKVALKDVSIIFDFQQTFRTDRYKGAEKMHILENDVSQVE